MRIESDFHDYYDCMMRHGIEPRLVYERRTREVQLRSPPRHGFYEDRIAVGPYFLRRLVIGFCGRLYPALSVDHSERGPTRSGVHGTFYCVEDVDKIVSTLPLRFRREYEERAKIRGVRETRRMLLAYFGGETLGDIDNALARFGRMRGMITGQEMRHFFIDYHSPVWVLGGDYRLIVNPRLADFEFFRVVSTEQAFQEISMYMASVLSTPEKPIPAIDDRTMSEAKGFDKYSFRKDKPERRKSR